MSNILTSVENEVLLVTLNRPKVLNALNSETLKEVVTAIKTTEAKVAIITGNHKAFAAGADIKQLAASNPIDQLKDERESLWQEFKKLEIPVIAAVNGFCLGGGHELALACDITISGDNAKYGQPEINIGTIPGAGGTQRLVRALGKSKTMELCLSGAMITADQALAYGLVSQVVPYQTTVATAMKLAQTIASKSQVATKLIKQNINYAYESHLEQGLAFERRNFYLTFASQDQKEGMNAFIEKRAPNYTGN